MQFWNNYLIKYVYTTLQNIMKTEIDFTKLKKHFLSSFSLSFSFLRWPSLLNITWNKMKTYSINRDVMFTIQNHQIQWDYVCPWYSFLVKNTSMRHKKNLSNSIWVFFGSCTVFTFLFPNFQIFRPEYHWRDQSSRNVHMVHQNWYRISFTFKVILKIHFNFATLHKHCMSFIYIVYCWRDFISRNVHLVHRNWYRFRFAHFNPWVEASADNL
jgi:hypothetical protein